MPWVKIRTQAGGCWEERPIGVLEESWGPPEEEELRLQRKRGVLCQSVFLCQCLSLSFLDLVSHIPSPS